ncbi:MAG TPA: hypothetical protein VN176_02145 [Verrucomicrobiae bacterium]|jgi:hypothetical protein|nr:hypothetical protein [Verrucomicrobiae bacterium]
MAQSKVMPTQKPARLTWKIIRWSVVAVLVLVLALLLKKPVPVAAPMTAAEVKQNAAEFQSKLIELQASHNRGEPAEAHFNADEVNAAFQQGAQEQVATPAQPATPPGQSAAAPEAPPEVKTLQVVFVDDSFTVQFAINVYGKDVYLTISGKLGVTNGYATFEFTEAKIDDLPVPVSLLNPRLQEKLQEPENREKLKLPAYIADLRVENSQLVIVEK